MSNKECVGRLSIELSKRDRLLVDKYRQILSRQSGRVKQTLRSKIMGFIEREVKRHESS